MPLKNFLTLPLQIKFEQLPWLQQYILIEAEEVTNYNFGFRFIPHQIMDTNFIESTTSIPVTSTSKISMYTPEQSKLKSRRLGIEKKSYHDKNNLQRKCELIWFIEYNYIFVCT